MVLVRRRSSNTVALATLLLGSASVMAAPTPDANPDPVPVPDPIPDTPTMIMSNQTSMNTGNTPNWGCDQQNGNSPIVQDCLESILDMSSAPQMGQFHHQPPQDAFSLPKIYTTRTCSVRLDIAPGAIDSSTWTDINIRTTQIINVCAKGPNYPQSPTGGNRKAGNYGRIFIYIEPNNGRPDGQSTS